ncbi:mitochondrial ribosome recycling factor [Andalucia godoyi]|uniref:Mitochondrial ribosome recycling factor n=1 Tax=Andalucia godoyi TaxID=505711 RepID=A0A8K0AGP3_ANDGO|nr:mitochondrial ribosome recycling factor [Andalucia godoyi]|eukprot:ANDGO_03500.mRNA.1 mitochondrial ribosome recycling factor
MNMFVVLRRYKANLTSLLREIPGNPDSWKMRMDAAVMHLQSELSNLRTSRPVASILDNVKVSSGPSAGAGKHAPGIPLSTIAAIVAKPPSSILVSPHDPNLMNSVQQAIKNSFPGYGVSASSASSITVSIPRVTGDQREKMVKEALKFGENAKVTIRQVRKDWLKDLERKVVDSSSSKGAAKGKADKDKDKDKGKSDKADGMGKEEFKRVEKAVQSVTDEMVSSVESVVKQKEKDLLEN